MNGRPATLDDASVLLAMISDFFEMEKIPFADARHRPALEKLLSEDNLGRVFVFEEEGHEEPIGYAVMTFGYDLEWGGRDAFVTDVYLVPTWRGRGAGKHAMEIVEVGARACGVRALHLMVDPENGRAERLYASRGFSRSHRVMMTKELEEPLR